MNKILKKLTAIITLYDKTLEQLSKALESCKENIDFLDVIVIYRNSNNFNYDSFLNGINFIKAIKIEDESIKKNGKMLIASKFVKTEFMFSLDPDDYIGDLSKAHHFLTSNSNKIDFISNSFFSFNNNETHLKKIIESKFSVKNKNIYFGAQSPLFNGASIYKTTSFRQLEPIAKDTDYFDELHPQDMILGSLLINNGLVNKITFMDIPFYYYVVDSENSVYRNNITKEKLIHSENICLKLMENKKWVLDDGTYVGGNYVWYVLLDSKLMKHQTFFEYQKFLSTLYKTLKKTNIPHKQTRFLKMIWCRGFRRSFGKKHRKSKGM